MLTRVDAEHLLLRFLALRADPSRAAEFFDLWASDADLLLGTEVIKKRDIDASQFVASQEQRARACLTASWAFPSGGPCEWVSGFDAEQTEGVIWARFVDERHGSLWLAFGVRTANQGAELVWVTLAPQVADWSFGKGRAMALSDIPFLRTSDHPHRDWLDLAYRRRYHPGDVPLLFQDDARFSCQGSGACCKMKWEVTTEAATQRFLDELPWAEFAPEFAGLQLEKVDDATLYVKRPDETCRFLDQQNRCRLHLFLGTPVFHTCIVYPYRFVETPDGVAVTTSHFCDSARAGFGLPLASQEADIRTRLSLSRSWTPPEQFLLAPVHPLSWQDFSRLERHGTMLLRDRQRDLHERLWEMTDLLARELGLLPDPRDAGPLNAAERSLAGMFLSFLFKGFADLAPEFASLAGAEPQPARMASQEALSVWLEHLQFGKEFSFRYDLVTAHAFYVVLYVVVLELERQHQGKLPDGCWRVLGTQGSHQGLVDLLDLFFKVAPFLRDEFANVSFARMLLRLVAPQFAGVAGESAAL